MEDVENLCPVNYHDWQGLSQKNHQGHGDELMISMDHLYPTLTCAAR